MLATETAIFRNSYFQRTPLTGCYRKLLKRLKPEPLVFGNIANHSADFTKKAQSRTFKAHFNSELLWNLEFAYLILPGTKFFPTAPGSLIAV